MCQVSAVLATLVLSAVERHRLVNDHVLGPVHASAAVLHPARRVCSAISGQLDATRSLSVAHAPDNPPSRLLITVNWSVNWFACAALPLLVVRRRLAHTNPVLWIGPGIGPQNWLPRQRTLGDRKTNFRSFIHSHSSINSVYLVTIGPADVEITCLTAF